MEGAWDPAAVCEKPALTATPRAVAAMDLDRDGKPEFAVAGSDVTAFLNTSP